MQVKRNVEYLRCASSNSDLGQLDKFTKSPHQLLYDLFFFRSSIFYWIYLADASLARSVHYGWLACPQPHFFHSTCFYFTPSIFISLYILFLFIHESAYLRGCPYFLNPTAFHTSDKRIQHNLVNRVVIQIW